MCIFKDGLSSLSDDCAKCKEEIPDVSDTNKMLKQHGIPKLTQNLKVSSSKGCRKTSQRWIMHVANTSILKLSIFSGRYLFRWWVFA